MVRGQSTHFRKLHKKGSQFCGQMRMRGISIGSSLGNAFPRAVILLASATDRELWQGPKTGSLRITDLVSRMRLPSVAKMGSYCACALSCPRQSSRSLALAKRIAALRTRMWEMKNTQKGWVLSELTVFCLVIRQNTELF